MSSHVDDFNTRNKVLTAKLLRQGYRYHKIVRRFHNFYPRHFDIVSNYNVVLKTLLLQGLTEPEFYGDLVYEFRKIIGKNDFPYHFKKIIVRYKKIGYNIDVLRQTACLVVNPIKVNSFAYLFHWGWPGGAMVLGKLPVPGRPTNLDHSRARAYCACSGCGWGLFGLFVSRLSFLFFFLPVSGRRPDID